MNGSLRITLRRAIGLIAVYALALQTIVSGIGLIHVSPSVGAFAAATICHSGNDTGNATDQIPADSGHGGMVCDHCVLCSLHAPVLPTLQVQTDVALASARPITLATSPSSAPLPDISSHPGKPRAPPSPA